MGGIVSVPKKSVTYIAALVLLLSVSSFMFFDKNLLTCLSFIAFLGLFAILVLGFSFKQEFLNGLKKLNFTIFIFAMLLIPWVIGFAIFFPGLMTFDSWHEWGQTTGVLPVTEQHPYIHMLLMKLGLPLLSVWPVTFLQISIVALLVCKSLNLILELGMSRKTAVLASIMIGWFPYNIVFVNTIWKDVIFTALFLLFAVYFIVILRKEKLSAEDTIFFVIDGVLTCLFRNNAFPVVVVCLLVLTFWKFKFEKRHCVVLLITLVTVIGFKTGVNTFVMPTKNHIAESLAVPIQQVGATYKNGGVISLQDRKIFEKYQNVDSWVNYDPYSVDDLKFKYLKTNLLDKSVGTFLSAWWRTLLNNKMIYLQAYWQQMSFLFAFNRPDGARAFAVQIDDYNEPVKRLFNTLSMYELPSKTLSADVDFKHLEEIQKHYNVPVKGEAYVSKITKNFYLTNSQIEIRRDFNVVLSPINDAIINLKIATVYVWITLLATFALCSIYGYSKLMMLPGALYFGTLLIAAPASDLRYAWVFIFSTCIFVALFFQNIKIVYSQRDAE